MTGSVAAVNQIILVYTMVDPNRTLIAVELKIRCPDGISQRYIKCAAVRECHPAKTPIRNSGGNRSQELLDMRPITDVRLQPVASDIRRRAGECERRRSTVGPTLIIGKEESLVPAGIKERAPFAESRKY